MSKKRTILLSDALDKYVNTVSCKKNGWQQESYRRNVIKRYLVANILMHEITSIDIAEYRDLRLSEINPRTAKPISGNTVRLELALISSLYNLAIAEWGTCKSNPVEAVRKPKCAPGRERRLTSLEERKISKLLKVHNGELYSIFKLALETGMRQGEILSLDWSNVNLQIGVAHLPYTKNGTSRDVPLSRKARSILTDYGYHQSGRVFKYQSSGVKSAWRNAMKQLKIEDLHFHDLRHEAISRLFELGTLNVMEIASISGHKSLNMLKRYTHLRAYQLVKKLDAKGRTVDKVATYFVPYPAVATKEDNGYVITFSDFEDLSVTDKVKEIAIEKASSILLKTLAIAAHRGKKIPVPGEVKVNDDGIIIINPFS